jgi:opacity protein-like surface antigen
MNSKMLVAAAVLIAAFASSALAQTAPQPRQQHSVNPSYDVYLNGQYVGSDPDPNILLQLQRRPKGGQW